MKENEIILSVKNLKKTFVKERTFLRLVSGYVKAVNDISFDLKKGETLALVGESGCGKTTTGRCIIRSEEATDGSITYYDESGSSNEINNMNKKQLKSIRQKIRMVFQDPFSSLNPRMTVEKIINEAVKINEKIYNKDELRLRVKDVLEKTQLNAKYMTRYPHAFSGGQRQRIALARALVIKPTILIADEPVSALDVSIQAQILNLMKKLQKEENLSYIFIAHNLGVVRYQSDRIAVMYLGKIVEFGDREHIFKNPLHPYTELLLASCPVPDPRINRFDRQKLLGDEMLTLEDAERSENGCLFYGRCKYSKKICNEAQPDLQDTSEEGHQVACYRAKELKLRTFSDYLNQ